MGMSSYKFEEIKFSAERIFRIFHIQKTGRVTLFYNLIATQPSCIASCDTLSLLFIKKQTFAGNVSYLLFCSAERKCEIAIITVLKPN